MAYRVGLDNIDVTNDIVLDADGDNITFKAGSDDSTGLDFQQSNAGDWTFGPTTVDKDLILKVNKSSVVTEVMRLKGSNGFVGIGTGSPTHALHIANTGPTSLFLEADTDNANEDDTSYIKMTQDGGATGAIFGLCPNDASEDPAGDAYTDAVGSSFLFGTTTSTPIQLGTNDAVRMTIKQAGNVGIGMTNPQTKLTVEGTITLKEQADADGDTAAYGQIWVNTATPNELYYTTDAGDDIQITSGTALAGGDASVGSANTFTEAQVVSKDQDSEFVALVLKNESDANDTTGLVSLRFDLEDTGGNAVDSAKIAVKKEAAFTATAGTQDSKMVFSTSLDGALTERMTLDSGGNLGIGIATPTALLHVSSSANNDTLAQFDAYDQSNTGFTIRDNDGAVYVTINNTSQVQYPLDVNGNARAHTFLSTVDGTGYGLKVGDAQHHLHGQSGAAAGAADQDLNLFVEADKALNIRSVDAASGSGLVLNLQTAETDIAADDALATINFQAPLETTGTDAILVAASIAAISEGDFAADNNATKLSFKTGASEAAAEKMALSSAGNLSVTGELTAANSTFNVSQSSSDVTLKATTSNKDMKFNVNDGGSDTTVMTLDGDVSAVVMNKVFGHTISSVNAASANHTEITPNASVIKVDMTGASTTPIQGSGGWHDLVLQDGVFAGQVCTVTIGAGNILAGADQLGAVRIQAGSSKAKLMLIVTGVPANGETLKYKDAAGTENIIEFDSSATGGNYSRSSANNATVGTSGLSGGADLITIAMAIAGAAGLLYGAGDTSAFSIAQGSDQSLQLVQSVNGPTGNDGTLGGNADHTLPASGGITDDPYGTGAMPFMGGAARTHGLDNSYHVNGFSLYDATKDYGHGGSPSITFMWDGTKWLHMSGGTGLSS